MSRDGRFTPEPEGEPYPQWVLLLVVCPLTLVLFLVVLPWAAGLGLNWLAR